MNSKRTWRGNCSGRIAQVGKGENNFLRDFLARRSKKNETRANLPGLQKPEATEKRTPHHAATFPSLLPTQDRPAPPRRPPRAARPLSGRGWGQRFPAFSQRMLLLPIGTGSTHARVLAVGSGRKREGGAAAACSLPPSRAGRGTRSCVLTEGWGEECSCPVLPGLGSAFSVSPCTSLLLELPRSRSLWRPSPRCDRYGVITVRSIHIYAIISFLLILFKPVWRWVLRRKTFISSVLITL